LNPVARGPLCPRMENGPPTFRCGTSVPIPDLTHAVQFVHRGGNSRAGQWAGAFRDQKPPSIVACPQIERHELTSVPERFPKIPSVSRDRGQRHHTPPCPDAGRIDAGAGRRGVKRCPSSRRLAAHHQHIGCQIERFISIAVARHLSGGRSYAGKDLQRLGCPGGIIEDAF
jgi:hypothetical protein